MNERIDDCVCVSVQQKAMGREKQVDTNLVQAQNIVFDVVERFSKTDSRTKRRTTYNNITWTVSQQINKCRKVAEMKLRKRRQNEINRNKTLCLGIAIILSYNQHEIRRRYSIELFSFPFLSLSYSLRCRWSPLHVNYKQVDLCIWSRILFNVVANCWVFSVYFPNVVHYSVWILTQL